MSEAIHARRDSNKGLRKQQPIRKLTVIACFECRKRKCKCDGTRPICSSCQVRKTECDYDIASSSVRTGALKQRIRDLESSNASLVADGNNLRSTHQDLLATCRSLTSQLESHTQSAAPDDSIAVDDFASDEISDNSSYITPLPDTRTDANESLKGFLDHRRRSIVDQSTPSLYDILPPLDVTGCFNDSHIPDELSYWALQSSLNRRTESILMTLAHAYITWLHLCWLISPSEEITAILAQVQAANRNMPAYLFIPHAIVVRIAVQGMEAPVVSVENSWGENQSGATEMLSEAMPQWQYMGCDATFVEPSTGKTRLTQSFEAFIRGHRGYDNPAQTWRAQPDYMTSSFANNDDFDPFIQG